jgi:hypothetical protein
MTAALLQEITFFIASICAIVAVSTFFRVRFLTVRNREVGSFLMKLHHVSSMLITISFAMFFLITFFSPWINEAISSVRLFFYLNR